MKIRFKHGVSAMSGTFLYDGMVYCTNKQTGYCYARVKRKPELVENHHKFGRINRNLANFYNDTSTGYRKDLAGYTLFYKQELIEMGMPGPSVFGFFKKMMYALGKKYPEIDLEIITVDDVILKAYPIRTIKEAMENELLQSVTTFGELDKSI